MTQKYTIRIRMAAAGMITLLALAAPQVTRAATTIVVDDKTTADGCGAYDGDAAQTDVASAINTAANGSTIVICPGTYTLTGDIVLNGLTKLTIKRALTDLGNSPVLIADSSASDVFNISGSTGVIIDGLVIDGTSNTVMYFKGIYLYQSGLTLNNTGIIGPAMPGSTGVYADSSGITKVKTVSITDCYIVGFYKAGAYARGAVKLTVTSSTLDGSDDGRVGGPSYGVFYDGLTSDTVTPTGTVTTSTISAQYSAVNITEASNVTVSNNRLIVAAYGVYIHAKGLYHAADTNKVTGNIILNVPGAGAGVYVVADNAGSASIKKLTVSSNTIIAAGFLTTLGFGDPNGVLIDADAPAAKTVTPTVSSNRFVGFPADTYVYNTGGNAGLTLSGNTTLP